MVHFLRPESFIIWLCSEDYNIPLLHSLSIILNKKLSFMLSGYTHEVPMDGVSFWLFKPRDPSNNPHFLWQPQTPSRMDQAMLTRSFFGNLLLSTILKALLLLSLVYIQPHWCFTLYQGSFWLDCCWMGSNEPSHQRRGIFTLIAYWWWLPAVHGCARKPF